MKTSLEKLGIQASLSDDRLYSILSAQPDVEYTRGTFLSFPFSSYFKLIALKDFSLSNPFIGSLSFHVSLSSLKCY